MMNKVISKFDEKAKSSKPTTIIKRQGIQQLNKIYGSEIEKGYDNNVYELNELGMVTNPFKPVIEHLKNLEKQKTIDSEFNRQFHLYAKYLVYTNKDWMKFRGRIPKKKRQRKKQVNKKLKYIIGKG